MKKFILLLLCILLISASVIFAIDKKQTHQPNWQTWVKSFRHRAIKDGISPKLFDRLFKNLQPNPSVIKLDRSQPEFKFTFEHYLKLYASDKRIKLGKEEYTKHKKLLDPIAQKYDIDPCIILALWGMESNYGRYLGKRPLIRSLATLAHDTRRSKFFTQELLYALHILEGKHISRAELKGSWAGATGQPQFMPSSWYTYAIDHNQDGKKDIWHSPCDIFASIANYLHRNGFQVGKPISVKVTLSKDLPHKLGLKTKKTVKKWKKLGVKINAKKKPNPALFASIIKYNGHYRMVFQNFRAIYSWNRSKLYVITAQYLASQLCPKSH